MGRTRYAWREVYVSALRESNPKKLIVSVERATTALERRYAEWGTHPGTAAELEAIRKAISALEGLLKEKLGTHSPLSLSRSSSRSSGQVSSAAQHRVRRELDEQAKRLHLLLRSAPLHGKRI
jgi:hypothetical protein